MRKTTIFLGVLLLLISGLPALADSINPVAVGGSLGVGSSATIQKTVTISAGTPTDSLVDVFFLADTTGSMGGVIGSVKAAASAILAGTAGLGSVAWGVGEYRDVSPPDYASSSFQYRLDTAITSTQAAVQAGINTWVAGEGYDTPESQLAALYYVATQPATGWRTGSSRILVWMGDAPGHDPDPVITEAAATAALVSNHIKVEAMDVGSLNSSGQATRIAAATGGAYYGSLDSASIVAAIQAAITHSFDNYTTVSLDTSEAGPHVAVSFAPGSYTGAFDRSVERTFLFDVTFTGVSPGTDTFNIYGTVDGGRVATEADSITVVGAPEPSAILLFGLMALGIGAPLKLRRRS